MPISKERAELIAETFIKTGGNKTKTAGIIKPHLKNENSKHVAGTRMIQNDKVQQIIRERIREIGENEKENGLIEILKRNLEQNKNFSASNEVIKIILDTLGIKQEDNKPRVNININDVESLREYVKAVNNELEKRANELS